LKGGRGMSKEALLAVLKRCDERFDTSSLERKVVKTNGF
jgi:hypothetical protein